VNLYNFDASSIILLWDKFKENIEDKNFVISDIALKEAKHKIDTNEFNELIETIEIYKKEPSDLLEAQNIKGLLSIQEDEYGGGVGENDIFIIAISKRTDAILVNDEKRQNNLPASKTNYKIPAVCNLTQINVKNINLTELLNINNLW
jgi:predicted nucleic acid-binding protein